jgi:UDP-glucose 4-epimerase
MSDTKQRVLLTGATGVIGAWAAREIAAGGGEPIGLTRGTTSVGRAILGDLGEEMRWMVADVEDQRAVTAAVAEVRPDVIAHLASAKPWQMDAGFVDRPNPRLGVDAIVTATLNVLEAARSLGVPRVVYAGSKASYGAFAGEYGYPTYHPVPESLADRPTSVYGITKLAAEQLGEYYDRHLGVEFISLRFASTYGPFKRGGGRTAAAIISAAIEGRNMHYDFTERELTLLKDELIFNRDVGRAVWLACQADSTERRIYNIGSGTLHSIKDVLEALEGMGGVVMPTWSMDTRPEPTPSESSGCLFDVSAAARHLQFRARYDLAAGLAETAEIIGAGDRNS